MSNTYVHRDHSRSVRDYSRSVRDEKDRVSMSNTYVHRDRSRSVRDEKDLVTMENIHYMSPETTSSLLGTKMTG